MVAAAVAVAADVAASGAAAVAGLSAAEVAAGVAAVVVAAESGSVASGSVAAWLAWVGAGVAADPGERAACAKSHDLDVEPQQVVLGQAEAADGWFGL